MAVHLHSVTFDTADPPALARFWAAVTGYRAGESNPFYADLAGDGSVGPRFMFIKVPEAKAAKNRVHFDLGTADLDAEVDRVLGLGATLVARHEEWGATWATFTDPEGNEFCIGLHPPRPESHDSVRAGDLPADDIVADNIQATKAIYFAWTLEELKLFAVADRLVELFTEGLLPVGRGETGDLLFRFFRRGPDRLSEAERRNLYARTFGAPGGDATVGTPNTAFEGLWLRFLIAVLDRDNARVAELGRKLAANLSVHGSGLAFFAAHRLNDEIREIVQLLSDPAIREAFGARDTWHVVEQVAATDLGGAGNSLRQRTRATSGASIIGWLATRAGELAAGTAVLGDDADALLVEACEEWVTARAGEAAPPGP